MLLWLRTSGVTWNRTLTRLVRMLSSLLSSSPFLPVLWAVPLTIAISCTILFAVLRYVWLEQQHWAGRNFTACWLCLLLCVAVLAVHGTQAFAVHGMNMGCFHCHAQAFNLPHLFVTGTQDEVSDSKFDEIEDLERIMEEMPEFHAPDPQLRCMVRA